MTALISLTAEHLMFVDDPDKYRHMLAVFVIMVIYVNTCVESIDAKTAAIQSCLIGLCKRC